MARLPVLVLIALTPAMAWAQNRFPPDSLVNVQVLPPSISPREVIGLMRQFTFATGLRCSSCHVGREDQPLDQYDFASDDKRQKKVAREMLRMVRSINQQTLAALPERPAPPVEVTCNTCHRGVARPMPLDQLVVATVESAGVDSALDEYRALRSRYFGRDAYDFGEATLNAAALTLTGRRRFDAALALLIVNTEHYPGGADVAATQGEVYRAQGDTVAAIRAYREALVRNPRHPLARQRLGQLGQQP